MPRRTLPLRITLFLLATLAFGTSSAAADSPTLSTESTSYATQRNAATAAFYRVTTRSGAGSRESRAAARTLATTQAGLADAYRRPRASIPVYGRIRDVVLDVDRKAFDVVERYANDDAEYPELLSAMRGRKTTQRARVLEVLTTSSAVDLVGSRNLGQDGQGRSNLRVLVLSSLLIAGLVALGFWTADRVRH